MMKLHAKHLLTQPLVAIVTSAVAAGIIVDTWVLGTPTFAGMAATVNVLLLMVALMCGLYLAKQFPVHIRYITKIEMGSVALFLMAVLLPAALATSAAAAGCLIAELGGRKRTGLYLSDITTQAARLSIVVFAGSLIAHFPPHGLMAYAPLLILTAVVMLLGDILTTPLLITPVTGERPIRIIVEMGRGIGGPEAGQYFLGLIGATLAHFEDPWAASLLILPIALLYKTSKRVKELHESTRVLLEHMADTVDARDSYTHDHSRRVTDWTRQILKELNIIGPEAQLIVTAARVHDIGKIAIPDQILHKHEQLSPEEWAVMETHPAVGADMLARYPAFARGAAIVRGHHERWDGAGYPDRMRETDIPFGARVIAVVDSFDAMTSDRPYHAGMSWERAAAVLSAGRGTQWDPDVINAFLQVIAPQLETSLVPPGGIAAASAAGQPAGL